MSDLISGISNTNYADTYDATASSLTSKLNNTDYSTATDEELMSVCKDFESYFLEQVLKSMEKMAEVDSDDDDDSTSSLFSSMAGITGSDDSAMSTLSNYFGDEMISSYASILSEANQGDGLGIAQMLYEQMKRNYSTDSIPTAEE